MIFFRESINYTDLFLNYLNRWLDFLENLAVDFFKVSHATGASCTPSLGFDTPVVVAYSLRGVGTRGTSRFLDVK